MVRTQDQKGKCVSHPTQLMRCAASRGLLWRIYENAEEKNTELIAGLMSAIVGYIIEGLFFCFISFQHEN